MHDSEFLLDYQGDGRRSLNGFNAFTPRWEKLFAYATIYEEISHCQNKIRDLEKEIAKYKASILSWKSYNNSLSDISRLPDDILIEVWKYLAFNSDRVSLQWLRVTHVCSRWRRVALNCPILWSWPALHRPDVASLLLQRAKSSRLTLVVDLEELSRLDYKAAINLASSVLPRAKAIFLKMPSNTSQITFATGQIRMFLANLQREDTTRNLITLNVIYRGCPLTSSGQSDLVVFDVLRKSPHLRSIILVNRNAFASQLPLSSISYLTHLEVRIRRGDSTQLSSMWEVFGTLDYLPNLQVLSLLNVFKALDEKDITWYNCLRSPVVFTALRNLYIAASAQSSHLFLDSIHYPSTTSIELRGLWDDQHKHTSPIDSLRSILTITTRRITPSTQCLRLRRTRKDDDWLFHFSNLKAGRTPSEPILLIFIPPTLHDLQLIAELPRLCPLDNVRDIWYDLPISNLEIWKSFGVLPRLAAVKLNSDFHPGFMKACASLHPSGDSIFDALPYLAHPDQDSSEAESLYFSGAGFEVTYRAVSDLAWLRIDAEHNRIWAARWCWARHLQRRQLT